MNSKNDEITKKEEKRRERINGIKKKWYLKKEKKRKRIKRKREKLCERKRTCPNFGLLFAFAFSSCAVATSSSCPHL